ncbi:MAG: SpoVR family protein [Kistimonas sp.]|nr:SpoVR family protein [Kistimonas sp.]
MTQPVFTDSEWSFRLVEEIDHEISLLAREFGLDTWPNQIEVINSEQMLDAYASVGMPLMYNHWSFGKHFLSSQNSYQRGHMGLAYEIVINSNPCISYLMEENSMTMQTLVIAHACYGHNSFFKGNYLFRTWTDADSIIDYLMFAKNYIAHCEEKYGIDAVEEIMDAAHALQSQGVNRYKRPKPLSAEEEKSRQKSREEYVQRTLNALWSTIPQPARQESDNKLPRFPAEPEENILYFIEKHAPLLETWQRELIRIVRKLAQYFYPQKQTKVMNEGWATFWHYTLMNSLHSRGKITDGSLLEFFKSHTNVVFQPGFDDPRYSGINPYTLGYNIFTDMKRICLEPTPEDRQWFPDFAGSGEWQSVLDYAMRNFKDESFILQYLSPKVMRDMRLFTIASENNSPWLEVSAIHNEECFSVLRSHLADQYNLGNLEPNIQVYKVDIRGDRSMILRHYVHNGRPLDAASAEEIMGHVEKLWGFPVSLESVDGDSVRRTYKSARSRASIA